MNNHLLTTGRVSKAFCGYLNVLSGGQAYLCKPRGNISFQDINVGDLVEFTILAESKGMIEKILPRKNLVKHPHAANIDQIVIVISLREPEVNLEAIDQFLCLAGQYSVKPILCLNKVDLVQSAEIKKFREVYNSEFYSVLLTSTKDDLGLGDLAKTLQHKVSVFAGPSGVGKSSLLNALNPQFHLKVGDVSRKNLHGKHTTRDVELFSLTPDSLVLDSPGFTLLELDIEKQSLSGFFPEIQKLSAGCKFSGCLHLDEPDCAVKQAVQAASLANSRYNSYSKFLKAAIEKERNQYKRQYKSSFRKGTSKKWKRS